eukprot:151512_1
MAQESNQSGYNPIPINTTFNSMAAYASGGFGHIFLMGHLGARWHGKVIKRVEIIQEERDDILREIECAQKCKSVQNPSRHILHFDEVYMDSTHILMEMDLCAFSLHEYPHPIIYEDRMDIMRSISNGILTMHALGIAHRDLKPENILVQRNGNCVIADFGLSRIIGHRDEEVTRWCGTSLFQAPEIALDNYSQAVDIWSLGVILLELLEYPLPPYKGATNRQHAAWCSKMAVGGIEFCRKYGGTGEYKLLKLMLVDEQRRANIYEIVSRIKLMLVDGQIEIVTMQRKEMAEGILKGKLQKYYQRHCVDSKENSIKNNLSKVMCGSDLGKVMDQLNDMDISVNDLLSFSLDDFVCLFDGISLTTTEAAYNAVMDVNEVNEQKEDQLNDDKLQLNDWMSMIMGESDDAVKNNKMNSKETEEQNADEDYKHGIYLDTVDVSTHLKEKIRGSLAKLYKALNQVVTVKQIGAKQVVQMPSNLEDYSVEHMVYLIENNDTILCDKLKPYQAKIVDYFESHQMDGTTWLAQDRKSFLDDVSGYIFEQQ